VGDDEIKIAVPDQADPGETVFLHVLDDPLDRFLYTTTFRTVFLKYR
jgi:hypothetical protein